MMPLRPWTVVMFLFLLFYCASGANRACTSLEFRCNNGFCLEGNRRCDGLTDCSAGEDETNCICGHYRFECDGGKCIDIRKRCDGNLDCEDNSDESQCTEQTSAKVFTCASGVQIPWSLRCNQKYDCLIDGDYSDEKHCPCGEGDFKCDNGYCIPASKHCDQSHDCQDGSDERNCTNDTHCMASQYQCMNGKCINAGLQCDGQNDCMDNSDEMFCHCETDQFRCPDGSCINTALRCNGLKDCQPDGEDEFNCGCPVSFWKCEDGSCIANSRRCNGFLDCYDHSDEKGCDTLEVRTTTAAPLPRRLPCKEPFYQCNDGTCLDESKRCDGISDCSEKEDERDCVLEGCPTGYIQCDETCYHSSKRCDGVNDCRNGEDELDCKDCSHECDGRCLKATQVCNGVRDCYDGSDENDCDCAKKEDFRCVNGDCVDKSSRCNGVAECSDGSDEENCIPTVPPTCENEQFQCKDGECIYEWYVCDGNSDCADNSDEENCRCTAEQWQCENGECISETVHCDGYEDCVDSSDERNCPYATSTNRYYETTRALIHPPQTTVPPFTRPPATPFNQPSPRDGCNKNEWRCENGPCINQELRCNGYIDCLYDSSDEFDCPPDSPVVLNLKTYPDDQTVRNGGDVVLQCRDEGPYRAEVQWVRKNNQHIRHGATQYKGRLEMFNVSLSDSGEYICRAVNYPSHRGSEITAYVRVKENDFPIQNRSALHRCGPYESTCMNGQCIPRKYICDGKFDCMDRSDEDMCNNIDNCEPNQFICDNNHCVLKSWVCDNEDDCGDGSDEKNCGTKQFGDPCYPVEFTCNNSQCIPRSYHCDGSVDCMDGSDEVGCAPVQILSGPVPKDIKLHHGDILQLTCQAVGVPAPVVSWRLNWGHVPDKCVTTSMKGYGTLSCANMQKGDTGAYSCEAINNKGSRFAEPDAYVEVVDEKPVVPNGVCKNGLFNREARSRNECLRCFCFGISTKCESAELYKFNMASQLGEGGTRMVGVTQSLRGVVTIENEEIQKEFYYQPLRNGAAITKIDTQDYYDLTPFVTLPETYNGNQLSSYGGFIKYKVFPHDYRSIIRDDNLSDIIIKGRHGFLFYTRKKTHTRSPYVVEAQFVANSWQKPDVRGIIDASREDIMMVLSDVQMILLKAKVYDGGANLTEFVMESAKNIGLVHANLVEECTCPPGYVGYSCEKCSPEYERIQNGPWLGKCVKKNTKTTCPAGQYGDPNLEGGCYECPCPLTNKQNQFARTCHIGYHGRVICDCDVGYAGESCEYCAEGYTGNPTIPGDQCRPEQRNQCNRVGTEIVLPGTKCKCKDSVIGQFCDECAPGNFYLSNDFKQGCAQCFCTGVVTSCTSSNLRRRIIAIGPNYKNNFEGIKIYKSTPHAFTAKYNAATLTDKQPIHKDRYVSLNFNPTEPDILYWSLPPIFGGDKVTSYGGYLRFSMKVINPDTTARTQAPDVQLISDNHLTFHYIGNFEPDFYGNIKGSVQFLEDNWQRADGKPVSREHLLLALADVKTILIKAKITHSTQNATLEEASIEIAEPGGMGPLALHVEQCMCPTGYLGTSCEDCAPGYTRSNTGLYLKTCVPCKCNNRADHCHPETGVCFNCKDHTTGVACDECIDGYIFNSDGNCVRKSESPDDCGCDPRGTIESEEGNCRDGTCMCKDFVHGRLCDSCRPGYFELNENYTQGCLQCFCGGVSSNCKEALTYTRIAIPAPILGENYGGYMLLNAYGDQVLHDEFVPAVNESELIYILKSHSDGILYWSLPVFPGDRVLSYGGNLYISQRFHDPINPEPSYYPNEDIIFVGNGLSIVKDNIKIFFNQNKPTAYTVRLTEEGWYERNSRRPVTREVFMKILANLERVMVRATTGSETLYATSIADVSMDTAADKYNSGVPAKGVELCSCPPEYIGTSCESCSTLSYRTRNGFCESCNCNGHSCYLSSRGNVVCNCLPPFTGRNCNEMDTGITTASPLPETSPTSTISVQITSPTIKIQEIGSSVNFTCQAYSIATRRSVNVQWQKLDGMMPIGRYSQTGGTLTMNRLKASDSGVYICQASDGLSFATASVTLKVPGNYMTVPEVVIKPTYNNYMEGDKIDLDCIASGNPMPSITWQRLSNRAFPASYEIKNSRFTIPKARTSDAGEYKCIATNAAGTRDRIVLITVGSRVNNNEPVQYLSVSPPSVSLDLGQSIKITCTGTDKIPPTSITWSRYDESMFDDNIQVYGNWLFINKATLENQGVYVCHTSTPLVEPLHVYVSVKSTDSTYTPQGVTVEQDTYIIPQGEVKSIDCKPSGYPLPTVRWIRDNGEMDSNMNQRGNTLTIFNAKRQNEGNYACEAVVNNEVIDRAYVQVVIELREPPQIDIYQPGVNIVPRGVTYQLVCRARGEPKPSVSWSRDEHNSLGNNNNLVEPGILTFEHVDYKDEGSYTCEAVNAAGRAKATATIRIMENTTLLILPKDNISIPRGDNMVIECRAQGYPLSYVKITKNGVEIVPKSLGSAILHIMRAHEEDAGEYYCVTETSIDARVPVTSKSFTVDIRRGDGGDEEGSGENIIQVKKPYKTIVASEGLNIAIKCNTTDPYVQVEWSREDKPLQNNAWQVENELIIQSPTKRDSGVYECLILTGNSEPTNSNFIYLQVLSQPRITLNPPTQTVQPGQSPKVECIVHGEEITETYWKPLTRKFSTRVEATNTTLIFHHIQEDDAGLYECIAKNPIANASSTAEVIVNEKSNRLPSVSHDNEQHGHVGDEVHLSCQVTSGTHTIYWTKNNTKLPQSIEQRHDGSLFIRKAQESDSGHYVCHIRDEFGRQTKNYINLQIDGPNCNFRCYDGSRCIEERFLCDGHSNCADNSDEAECYLRDTDYFGHQFNVFIERLKAKYYVGENITIRCRIPNGSREGYWQRIGTNEYLNAKKEGVLITLYIPNASEYDSGTYRCVARNISGSLVHEDVDLKIYNQPEKLQPYGVNNMTVHTAHLRDNVVLPCNHNLPGQVTYEWSREYNAIPENVVKNSSQLNLRSVTADTVGVYICRVRNYRTSVEAKALLRVIGLVPKFNGDAYLVMNTIRDAYKRFSIDISIKPERKGGLILYNSEEDDVEGDFIALLMNNGTPTFILNVDRETGPIYVQGNKQIELNTWHRIGLKRTSNKLILDIDNEQFTDAAPGQYIPLDLHKPLYIGGLPNRINRPFALERVEGFVGCISKLQLGKVPMNIMIESIEKYNIDECDTCSQNVCMNNGVCQESNNDNGYVCYCDTGYSGDTCENKGTNSCVPGACAQGTCINTPRGYECRCPITATGKRCEIPQYIEYPAFTGSAYLAIPTPKTSKLFLMSFKIKANSPIKDGVIMYCAASSEGIDGYTALVVRDKHVEFQYDMGDGNGPLVLTSNVIIKPNEWIEVFIKRISNKVTMTVNGTDYQDQNLRSAKRDLLFDTPLFVGGYDDTITLNQRVGVTGGFNGCIKDISVSNTKIDITNSTLHSVNVQECSKQERGDVPEVVDSIDCDRCKNGGYCATPDAYSCTCLGGYTGLYCEIPHREHDFNTNDCDEFTCLNNGQCVISGPRQCECPIGYAGENCETPVLIEEKVSFDGDGYVELPKNLLDYSQSRITVAMAIISVSNYGVLFFQTEMAQGGDFILLQLNNGSLSCEWNLGSGQNGMTLKHFKILPSKRYVIILEILPDNGVTISVNGSSMHQKFDGISRIFNVNSNIFLGGIPKSLNNYKYDGYKGCIHQVEFMDMPEALEIGKVAISGVNVHDCAF